MFSGGSGQGLGAMPLGPRALGCLAGACANSLAPGRRALATSAHLPGQKTGRQQARSTWKPCLGGVPGGPGPQSEPRALGTPRTLAGLAPSTALVPPLTVLWARCSHLPSVAAPALATRAGPLGLMLAPWAQRADEDRRLGGRGQRVSLCPAAWPCSQRGALCSSPALPSGWGCRPTLGSQAGRGRPCLPRSFYDAL